MIAPRALVPPASGAALTMQLFVIGVLVNPLNASRWTHWKRSAWAKNWKEIVHATWLRDGRPTWDGPATMTFTGHVAKLFDDEGFVAACKPIRDQAVALMLGTDDGPTCGHEFRYRQETRPVGERGVLITVKPK